MVGWTWETMTVPKFYFDIDDGDRTIDDDEGLDLADVMVARAQAIAVLPEIARDHVGERDSQDFVSVVRDEGGRPVFRAKLSLVTEWLT
jgi:hypothetical protein